MDESKNWYYDDEKNTEWYRKINLTSPTKEIKFFGGQGYFWKITKRKQLFLADELPYCQQKTRKQAQAK